MDEIVGGSVRVLLVDDHPVVRVGLRVVIEQDPRLAVVGEAATGREAVRLAAELRPDVVVLGLGLPDVGDPEVVRAIKERDPAARVLIVSMHGDGEHVLGMLDAGIDGYLLKQSPPAELRGGVLRVHAGERVLHQRVLSGLVARATGRDAAPPVEALTEREREVLGLLAEGATSKEIAAALGLAAKTVENHRSRILDKLGAVNSAVAVRTALAHGLLAGPGRGAGAALAAA